MWVWDVLLHQYQRQWLEVAGLSVGRSSARARGLHAPINRARPPGITRPHAKHLHSILYWLDDAVPSLAQDQQQEYYLTLPLIHWHTCLGTSRCLTPINLTLESRTFRVVVKLDLYPFRFQGRYCWRWRPFFFCSLYFYMLGSIV